VLPIGGLKEKLLAAQRGGIQMVIIPDENQRDLVEIPENIKGRLDIRPVRWIDEVLQLALTRQPVPLPEAVTEAVPVPVAATTKPTRRRRNGSKVQAH
jgi:ATP-dependent Lon protease